MKAFRCIAMAVVAGCALASCGRDDSKNVPAGQVSTKIIHNPKTADGIDVSQTESLPKMVFADTSINFGMMAEGESAEHEFSFTNKGKSPLLIAGATASCGCTTPSFTREPIPPGGSGLLKVAFASAGKRGHVLKAVTVSSNAFPSTQVLTITADIKETK